MFTRVFTATMLASVTFASVNIASWTPTGGKREGEKGWRGIQCNTEGPYIPEEQKKAKMERTFLKFLRFPNTGPPRAGGGRGIRSSR